MTLPDLPPPTLRLRIDQQALMANWKALDQMSGAAQAGAAVKADAYGVGVDSAVPALQKAGAQHFFVAHWSEVPAVLAHVAPHQISVLHGVSNANEANWANQTGVRPVLNSAHQIGIWTAAGGGPCHVMIDSGMNRLGCTIAQVKEQSHTLEIAVLMSHLASADEDSGQNARQLEVFREAANHIEAKQYSLANSAGIALGADYHFDLTRPGLSLYGGIARPELEGKIAQVAFPEAAILQMRNLTAGDQVGYNAQFTATSDMRVATVSVGYADGFLRCWGPEGALQHGANRLPVLGRISMDMVVVDCTDVPDLKEGDFLGIAYHLPSAAKATGLSQYELLTLMGTRFSR